MDDFLLPKPNISLFQFLLFPTLLHPCCQLFCNLTLNPLFSLLKKHTLKLFSNLMQMGSCSTSEPQQDSLSFFKVIRYPSSPHIALPSAFVETHSKKMSRNPTLKTASGDYSWSVEIKRIGEDYCFANGWEKVAQDVQLCIKDIVVFWLADAYTIQVTFFGADGCEKKHPLIKSNNGHDVVDEAMEDEDLSFQKVIRVNTQRYAMVLPQLFVRAAGLENKTMIKMKDYEGYEWRVGIIVERNIRTKHSLSAGWSKFRQHCNLADGDVCFFKYDKKEGILNLTHVIRSKRSTTSAVDAVRIEDECSPTDKPSDGAKVSVECESDRELDMAQRNMGRPLLNGGTDVKIIDEWDAEAIAMRKKRRILLEKNEQERERVVRSNQVIYF